MKKKLLITIVAFLFTGFAVNAQKQMTSLQYSVGFGVGSLHNYIAETSFRGVNFEYRNLIEQTYSIGFEIGLNTFYKNVGYSSITEGTATLTGTQYRYVNAVPAMITADYYFGYDDPICPYFGLGVGTMYTNNKLDMGVFQFSKDTWHFLLRPELGIIFNTNTNTSFILAAKYNNAFKTQEINTRNYLTLNAGFVWSY